MGALDTAFKNAFPVAADADTTLVRALGASIETYLAAPYTLNANTASAPTSAPAGTIQRFIGKDADAYQVAVVDSFGGAPAIRLRRANGTGALPTAVLNGDIVGRLDVAGYYTTGGPAYATVPAGMRGEATQDWTSTAQGSRLVFATTPNSSATPQDALYIGQDQSVRAKGALGYIAGVGAGNTVSQATSRVTGVTLNAVTGQIVLFTAAGSSVGATFTLTNSFIAATDILLVNVSGAPTGLYYFGIKVGAGAAQITVFCPGNNSESVTLNFAVIKGSAN